MELLSRNRLFQTTDPDAGRQFAGQMWEKHRSILKDGQYGLRWNQVDLESASFSYVEHESAVDVSAEGPLSDHFRVFLHQGGAIEHRLNGRSVVSDVGKTVVHAPGVELKLNIQPSALLGVSLRGDLVQSALAQRFRKMPPVQDWLGSLPNSPCVEAFRSTAEWLAGELSRPGSPLIAPGKPRLHAERMLLSLFMGCLTEAAPIEADPILELSEAQVRRAEEWIEAHIMEPVGIEEVSAAVGIGLRSLRRSFQRVRGYSPRQAMVHLRLERVRDALLRAEPGATVTGIATEYGFLELGRFSMRYRQEFGEAPSQTLARRIGPG
jgi:AraC-like DNA-binding protein